jgi:hypothetical protein
MELHLSDEQAGLLRRVVDTEIHDLGFEIADTDNPAFRRDLEARRVLLRQILDRLGGRPTYAGA